MELECRVLNVQEHLQDGGKDLEWLEPVSKIPQHDFHASQPHHTEEILDVVFPACGQATIVLQPGEQTLDGPASPIAP